MPTRRAKRRRAFAHGTRRRARAAVFESSVGSAVRARARTQSRRQARRRPVAPRAQEEAMIRILLLLGLFAPLLAAAQSQEPLFNLVHLQGQAEREVPNDLLTAI